MKAHSKTASPDSKRWLLLLLCTFACILPSVLRGQGRLYSSQSKVIQFSGVVVNGADSKPLPFSTVMILNHHRGTVADASGFFSFVAVVGDTVEFSTVGFSPRRLIIPDTIRHDAYSIVMPLEQDTIMLMETVIYPWPTKEKFREAFINLELPETEADIIRRNFNLALVREQAREGKMDANMNYRSLMQQQTTQLYYQNQMVPNNLLNPFAWAQFIKQWRRRKDADKIMELVGLKSCADLYPNQVSASMMQRIAVSRAFAVNPDLLLMDEPYGQLDVKLRFYLEDELVKIWQKLNATVLFVTHNVEEAVYIAERVLILSNKPTHIKAEIPINLPRPRDTISPEFVELRKQVTELIRWW